MGADGTGDYYYEEEGGNDAGDAVQDDHGNGGGGRGAQRVLLSLALALAVTTPRGRAGEENGDGVLVRSGQGGGLVKKLLRDGPVSHGEDGEVVQGWLNVRVVAEIRGGAVQNDGGGVVEVCLLEDLGSAQVPPIVQGVAAYVGNVVCRHIRGVLGACVVEVAV